MKLMNSLRRHSGARAARTRNPSRRTYERKVGFRVRRVAAPRNDGLGVSSPSSIRFRHAEHLLGNKAENELRADRGDARDQRFPQVALDVIFLRISEPAMRHDRLLAGMEAGFGGEVFRGVGGRAAWHALVVLPARAQ